MQADKNNVQWTVFSPSKHGGLLSDEMRRLKAREDETTRLKQIVADQTLDREMLHDVIGKSSEARPLARTPHNRECALLISPNVDQPDRLKDPGCRESSRRPRSVEWVSNDGYSGAVS